MLVMCIIIVCFVGETTAWQWKH